MRIGRPNRFFLITLSLCLPLIASYSLADIYRFKDENGIWHFTNVKRDKRYNLYIRLNKQTPSSYIRDYGHIIKQAAGRFGVDPALVKAIIKAESAFDHQSVSSKGAQGLMQLMPQTVKDMDVKDPFNPEENIFGGTRYLSLLLDKFNNNKKLALAAYNAGPEKVKEYNGIPPFIETKNFVKKVLQFYQEYLSAK